MQEVGLAPQSSPWRQHRACLLQLVETLCVRLLVVDLARDFGVAQNKERQGGGSSTTIQGIQFSRKEEGMRTVSSLSFLFLFCFTRVGSE